MPVGIFYLAIAVLAIISLSVGVYTDVKSREINSLLFIPLLVAAVAYNIYIGFSILYVALETAIFLSLFLVPDSLAFIALGIIYLVLSAVLSIAVSPYMGFQSLISSLIYIMGYRERLFGIGDIKAIISTLFATPFLESAIPGTLFLSYLPVSIQYLFAISVSSMVFIAAASFVLKRNASAFGLGGSFVIEHDERFQAAVKNKYAVIERSGKKFLSYRIPFMVPILAGYILLIFGLI
ncbi:MAG: hypothetical protein QXV22_00875 [Thermoplasmataceae archaeon]